MVWRGTGDYLNLSGVGGMRACLYNKIPDVQLATPVACLCNKFLAYA